MSVFETSVGIRRPIDDVFAYVSDPLNMPSWYSAVQDVSSLSGAEPQAGSTYVMHRHLPGGPARNELEIATWDPPTQFALRTTSGPTPLTYRYRFSPDGGAGTTVHLHATVELSGIAALAGGIAVRGVKRGMDANLATLKAILER
jgi:uncharacterized protein YndB with AHSA1/START domain